MTNPTNPITSDDKLVETLRGPMFERAGELGKAAHAAADRISSLEAEVARYREALGRIVTLNANGSRLIASAALSQHTRADRCPECGGAHKTGPGMGGCNGPPSPSKPHPHAGRMQG